MSKYVPGPGIETEFMRNASILGLTTSFEEPKATTFGLYDFGKKSASSFFLVALPI